MKSCCFVENVNGYEIRAEAVLSGNDLTVIVKGGSRPHIGSVSIAVPRKSMLNDGDMSATVSTINLPGHKDNEIGDMFAKGIAIATGSTCVVTCGIHIDNITKDEIDSVLAASKQLLDRMTGALKNFGQEV